jgi:amino acid transporter
LIFFPGAGIFVLSGQAAATFAGPSVIISFIVTGIVALLSALSFAELAAMMPLSGAAYTYTYAGQLLIVFILAIMNIYSYSFRIGRYTIKIIVIKDVFCYSL